MKTDIVKKIGKSTLTFQIEGDKELETLVMASGFTTMPDTCELCGDTDVELGSNKSDNFSFVKIKCLNPKCGATSTMGQYKDGKGIFWKKFEIYQKENNE